jgi:hypothetical protein
MTNIEDAVPTFLFILQKLFQGNTQLIHLDLHTGNIFIKENPFKLGMADFGHCVSRHNSQSGSKSFYGEFLVNNIARFTFYDGHFTQAPFEACLMNYCYKKHMESADPYSFIQSWATDEEVRQFSASSMDTVFASKDKLVKILLKKPLFHKMLGVIQSIVKKLRRHLGSQTALYESLNAMEKIAISFILSRYHVISPFNTISEDISNVYQMKEETPLKKFIFTSVLAPYEQGDTVRLEEALESIQDADMRILWADILSGNV